MARIAATPLQSEIHYPDSDGKPMAESDFHLKEMIYLINALQVHFRAVPDVYVSGNLLLYYAEGSPDQRVAPDVFVVKGVQKGLRRCYKLWVEGAAPVSVIEVTSESTREEDLHYKKDLYQRLGVEEYFLHDPLGDYLEPRLQGYRLLRGYYQPMEPRRDGSLVSNTLGLILRPEDPLGLRLVNSATGEPLRTYLESLEACRVARERLRVAEARLREIERLRSQI